MRFVNVNKFSANVLETEHDGHEVEIVRPLTDAERDSEVGTMQVVHCLVDGADFHAFAEELED